MVDNHRHRAPCALNVFKVPPKIAACIDVRLERLLILLRAGVCGPRAAVHDGTTRRFEPCSHCLIAVWVVAAILVIYSPQPTAVDFDEINAPFRRKRLGVDCLIACRRWKPAACGR